VVTRIGLTFEQIESLGLPWINNLITSSGEDLANPKHRDHQFDYVQGYIREFGTRKCEANALAAHPDEAARLIEHAITQYVPTSWPDVYEHQLRPHRDALRESVFRLIRRRA
jgi:hypothetical protein